MHLLETNILPLVCFQRHPSLPNGVIPVRFALPEIRERKYMFVVCGFSKH